MMLHGKTLRSKLIISPMLLFEKNVHGFDVTTLRLSKRGLNKLRPFNLKKSSAKMFFLTFYSEFSVLFGDESGKICKNKDHIRCSFSSCIKICWDPRKMFKYSA